MKDIVQYLLTPEARVFLNSLHTKFSTPISDLVENRKQYYEAFANDFSPDFSQSAEALTIKDSSWKANRCPDDLLDRRVEITGPPVRKMIINALNSGANVFMADFEDSNAPTWKNCIEGQANLYDAVRKTITYKDPNNSKEYKLQNQTAVLFVRPRGLHLQEKNYLIGDELIRACLFDFGLYFFHNYQELLKNGTAPYFYLPKLEHSEEAHLWANIFRFTEQQFNLPNGTIKATVLIETIPAVFQMEEIIYALKEYSVGLNCGRWDYIFSYIKCFKEQPECILPDRSHITMNSHFMRSYSQLLINTCHKRGVHAMGGMAAQIPIKNDPEQNSKALKKVREDKIREVQDGHDGTWVAHPSLVPVAKKVFDEYMDGPNQINYQPTLSRSITAQDLLIAPVGYCTEKMLRENIIILFRYISAWLNGNGCVPINHLMEDAATAEISRTQIWQWLHHEVKLDNRIILNKAYFNQVLREEIISLTKYPHHDKTLEIIQDICLSENLVDFLTVECYNILS